VHIKIITKLNILRFRKLIMIIEKCEIEGLLVIKPRIHEDERGYFFESYNQAVFKKNTGIDVNFIQDNESKSNYGTLRGIHFQRPPYSQSKLVRVTSGKVLDVAVDLRSSSPTFGKWESIVLSEGNKTQLFVPRGFGHGFVVLSDSAVFTYKVDNPYSAESDGGIIWNDTNLNIDWKIPNSDIILSNKDKDLQGISKFSKKAIFK